MPAASNPSVAVRVTGATPAPIEPVALVVVTALRGFSIHMVPSCASGFVVNVDDLLITTYGITTKQCVWSLGYPDWAGITNVKTGGPSWAARSITRRK